MTIAVARCLSRRLVGKGAFDVELADGVLVDGGDPDVADAHRRKFLLHRICQVRAWHSRRSA